MCVYQPKKKKKPRRRRRRRRRRRNKRKGLITLSLILGHPKKSSINDSILMA